MINYRGYELLLYYAFCNLFTEVISSVSQYTDKPGRKDVPVDDADNAVVTQVPPDDVASGDSTGVIVGILVGVIVLLVIVVAALFYRQRKLRETMVCFVFFYSSNMELN